MPSSGVWKMMKVAVWPVRICLHQVLVHDHLGDAAVRQAADETGAADVGIVDLEAEAGRQQHAHRGHHAQQARFVVGGLEDDDGDTDIGAVFGGHALNQRALLTLSTRRGIATNLPVAMHRADGALGGGRAGEAGHGQKREDCGREQWTQRG